MFNHHTKVKGDLGVLKVKLALFNMGFLILNPETEHAPFDLVAYKDSKFLRIQIKYRSMTNGVIAVPNSTSWCDKNGSHRKIYNLEDLDYFAIYCPETDKCYFIPTKSMELVLLWLVTMKVFRKSYLYIYGKIWFESYRGYLMKGNTGDMVKVIFMVTDRGKYD